MSNNSIVGFKSSLQPMAIDSLKIKLDTRFVETDNAILKGNVMMIDSETGEVLESEYKQKAVYIKANGIATRYGVVRRNDIKTKQTVEELVISVSSKALRSQYFEGITSRTIREIYNHIIKQKVVRFDYQVFLESPIIDVDLKADFIPKTDVKTFIKSLSKISISTSNNIAPFLKPGNVGKQFSHREGNSFRKHPFLKFYAKAVELLNNSNEFWSNYLTDIPIDPNLTRMETTIKNKQHFKYLGITNNSLEYVLNNLQDVSSKAFIHALNRHLEILANQQKRITKNKNLTDADKFRLYTLFDFINKNGTTVENCIMMISKQFHSDKSNQHKCRKRIKESYDKLERGNDYNPTIIEFSEMLSNFFADI